MVAAGESAALAEQLPTITIATENIATGQLTIHADHGPSMTSKPVAQLLVHPGVTRSHRRPHVSSFNPLPRVAVHDPHLLPQPPRHRRHPSGRPDLLRGVLRRLPPQPDWACSPPPSSTPARSRPKADRARWRVSSPPRPSRPTSGPCMTPERSARASSPTTTPSTAIRGSGYTPRRPRNRDPGPRPTPANPRRRLPRTLHPPAARSSPPPPGSTGPRRRPSHGPLEPDCRTSLDIFLPTSRNKEHHSKAAEINRPTGVHRFRSLL